MGLEKDTLFYVTTTKKDLNTESLWQFSDGLDPNLSISEELKTICLMLYNLNICSQETVLNRFRLAVVILSMSTACSQFETNKTNALVFIVLKYASYAWLNVVFGLALRLSHLGIALKFMLSAQLHLSHFTVARKDYDVIIMTANSASTWTKSHASQKERTEAT